MAVAFLRTACVRVADLCDVLTREERNPRELLEDASNTTKGREGEEWGENSAALRGYGRQIKKKKLCFSALLRFSV